MLNCPKSGQFYFGGIMGSFIFKKKEVQGLKPCRRIAVAAGCRSCGVSLVSSFIANGLRNYGSVSLSEPGRAYFYEALSMEKRFLNRGFDPFYSRLRKSEKITDVNNTECGINWYLRMPDDNMPLSSAELFRSFYIPKEEFAVYDCSGIDDENCMQLLAEADKAVVVIDPSPVKILESRDFLEKCIMHIPDLIIVVNKMNPGVFVSELNRFLGTKQYISVPFIPPDYLYRAEYAGVPPTGLKKLPEEYFKVQDILVNRIME